MEVEKMIQFKRIEVLPISVVGTAPGYGLDDRWFGVNRGLFPRG
jgi:hypothetical protein